MLAKTVSLAIRRAVHTYACYSTVVMGKKSVNLIKSTDVLSSDTWNRKSNV